MAPEREHENHSAKENTPTPNNASTQQNPSPIESRCSTQETPSNHDISPTQQTPSHYATRSGQATPIPSGQVTPTPSEALSEQETLAPPAGPSRWNLWARFRIYTSDHQNGAATPSNPYISDIDGLDGQRDPRHATPSPSALSLAIYNATSSSWGSVFECDTPKCSELSKYMAQNVLKDNFLFLQLSLLTIVTGVLDAATYTMYHVFTTKQTGNMLFLAVYVFDSGHLGYKVEVNIGISIAAFILGGVVFGYFANIFRPKRRAWIMFSLLVQTILTFVASAVQHWNSESETGSAAYIAIALLGFASAGQIAIAVGVGEPSLNTVMITGAVVQLTADSKILKKSNSGRNSRIGFIALYLAGCFIGSGTHSAHISLPFLIAACLKVAIIPTFFYNRGSEPPAKKDVEKKPRKQRWQSDAPAPPWGLH